MSSKPVIYINVNNHFDPIWRRCYDRKIEWRGQIYASYADMEEFYIEDNLALARKYPEYAFEIEGWLVLRTYLRRRPERLPELRDLARQGRLGIRGTGDNVIDSNMVLGETLVRNFVTGILAVEDTLGLQTRVGARDDGFGNSAQLPQIFRSLGIQWVRGIVYSKPKGAYWRGLDGSIILVSSFFPESLPVAAHWSTGGYYKPCPSCSGHGCAKCGQRGIHPHQPIELTSKINEEVVRKAGWGYIPIFAEEGLPTEALVRRAQKLRKHYDVRFGILDSLLDRLRDQLEVVDNPPADALHPSVELNPNNSGVWVSRIRLKQNSRRQEYALLAAESLAALQSMAGAGYPRRRINAVWADLHLTLFHDAVTGTVTDPPYDELLDIQRGIDRSIARLLPADRTKPADRSLTVFNPQPETCTAIVSAIVPAAAEKAGWSVCDADGAAVAVVGAERVGGGKMRLDFCARDVPGLGVRHFRLQKKKSLPAPGELREPVIENRRYRVVGDAQGLVEIFDKTLGRPIVAKREYRPGELILEHDKGSLWATMSPDLRRWRFEGEQKLERAERGDGFARLVYRFESRSYIPTGTYKSCVARTTVTLYDDIERVDFRTEVEWDTFNRRLRVAMPLPFKGGHWYGIPYGMLRREPYTPDFDIWSGANGDWPAVNWAGVAGRGRSVALFSRGLPSFKVESDSRGDTILLSLLRSPAEPAFLYQERSRGPHCYERMRDAGNHVFEYAIGSYGESFRDSSVEADGHTYAGAMWCLAGRLSFAAPPRVVSDHVRITALKGSEKGRALILRLHEYRGRKGRCVVTPPEGYRAVFRVNLLEREAEALPLRPDGAVEFSVRPWEIATLRMEPMA